ncbi:hypothetical protein PFISCL1PPCAC_26530 [Pristionchus fissidentatus]|uniref:Uncharacterized protein n=1 Tax=Pristionchus fissidentatus TaxID=1538716 RepID=A0AAV5WY97_9BILA|nr:hypothetical protein PFISCL1PPCAC_26530 [Pristionchus fissidentatus]
MLTGLPVLTGGSSSSCLFDFLSRLKYLDAFVQSSKNVGGSFFTSSLDCCSGWRNFFFGNPPLPCLVRLSGSFPSSSLLVLRNYSSLLLVVSRSESSIRSYPLTISSHYTNLYTTQPI